MGRFFRATQPLTHPPSAPHHPHLPSCLEASESFSLELKPPGSSCISKRTKDPGNESETFRTAVGTYFIRIQTTQSYGVLRTSPVLLESSVSREIHYTSYIARLMQFVSWLKRITMSNEQHHSWIHGMCCKRIVFLSGQQQSVHGSLAYLHKNCKHSGQQPTLGNTMKVPSGLLS